MSTWLPRSLFGRLTLVVAAGLMVLQGLTMVLHLHDRATLKALLDASGLLAQAPPEVLAQLQLPKAWHPVVMLTVILGVVLGVALVAVRWVTKPLQQLADAAHAFGQHLDGPPLPVNGPREAEQAATAFNTMQQQVRALVAERSRALEAVSHDLRTPLMRLRLRAELVEADELRAHMHRDIDAMDHMVSGVLGYLRGLQSTEAVQNVDLVALVDSLVDDLQALGHDVRWHADARPAAPVVAAVRLEAVRRALQNLMLNAVTHGQQARVSVARETRDATPWVAVAIADQGPGIPEADLARVTQPYVRLDPERGRVQGGVGLGLTVAQQAADLHHGSLQLVNATTGGLRATLAWPCG